MIQEQTKQAINGLSGLIQVPSWCAVKSRDYINHQSELMVLVTPYDVRAVAQKQLSRPDDGFADPNDPQSVLPGRLNRIYGAAGQTAGRPQPKTIAANTNSFSIEWRRDDERNPNGGERRSRLALRLLAVGALGADALAGCYETRISPNANTRSTIASAIRSR